MNCGVCGWNDSSIGALCCDVVCACIAVCIVVCFISFWGTVLLWGENGDNCGLWYMC